MDVNEKISRPELLASRTPSPRDTKTADASVETKTEAFQARVEFANQSAAPAAPAQATTTSPGVNLLPPIYTSLVLPTTVLPVTDLPISTPTITTAAESSVTTPALPVNDTITVDQAGDRVESDATSADLDPAVISIIAAISQSLIIPAPVTPVNNPVSEGSETAPLNAPATENSDKDVAVTADPTPVNAVATLPISKSLPSDLVQHVTQSLQGPLATGISLSQVSNGSRRNAPLADSISNVAAPQATVSQLADPVTTSMPSADPVAKTDADDSTDDSATQLNAIATSAAAVTVTGITQTNDSDKSTKTNDLIETDPLVAQLSTTSDTTISTTSTTDSTAVTPVSKPHESVQADNSGTSENLSADRQELSGNTQVTGSQDVGLQQLLSTSSAVTTTVSPRDSHQLVEQLSQLVLDSHDRGQQLVAKISPPDLGTISIDVQSHQGEVVVRMEASSGEAQQLLTEHLPQLHETLNHLGMETERIEIVRITDPSTVRDSGLSANVGDQGAQPSFSQQQQSDAERQRQLEQERLADHRSANRTKTVATFQRLQELNVRV
ncbi:hypothetical protein GC163_06370 [bacterium]|nr:hypothetical protein [bacterium]